MRPARLEAVPRIIATGVIRTAVITIVIGHARIAIIISISWIAVAVIIWSGERADGQTAEEAGAAPAPTAAVPATSMPAASVAPPPRRSRRRGDGCRRAERESRNGGAYKRSFQSHRHDLLLESCRPRQCVSRIGR